MRVEGKASSASGGHGERAAEQLIAADRHQRTSHRELVAGADAPRRLNSGVRRLIELCLSEIVHVFS
jgi:hypothetical protein